MGVLFSNALIGLSVAVVLLWFVKNIFQGQSNFTESIRKEKYCFYIVIPFVLSTLYGILISDELIIGWKEGRSSLQLIFLPCFAVLFKDLKLKGVTIFILMTLMVEFAWAWWNYLEIGGEDFRFHGKRPFGTDSLYCLVCTLSFTYLYSRKLVGHVGLWIAVVSLIFMILTQNRATGLVYVFLLPFVLFGLPLQKILRSLILIFAVLLIVIAVPSNQGMQRIWKSFETSIEEIDENLSHTSMGTRYQLWKASFYSIKDTNGFGTGYGDFKHDLKKYQKDQVIADDLNTLLHLHSIYLHPLMCAGILGILGVLWFLFALLWSQIKRISIQKHTAKLRALLLASFILTGLTDAHFEDSAKVFTFLLYWGLFSILEKSIDERSGNGSCLSKDQ